MKRRIRSEREKSERYWNRRARILGASDTVVGWLNANKRKAGYGLAVGILRELQHTKKEWTPKNQIMVSNRFMNMVRGAGLVPYPEFNTTGATIKFGFAGHPAVNAISRMFALCELDAIDRVFQCKKCKTWFLGSRNDAKFCSTACRVKWAYLDLNNKF